jgi:mannose-6-phosphate isomerase-like protein (cupin superfamily)
LISSHFDKLGEGNKFFRICEGKDYEISMEEAIVTAFESKDIVKVEGLESLVSGSKSVHMFISPQYSVSFSEHTDPVDLVIECIEGIKDFIVDSKWNRLRRGESIFVGAGVPHYAINNYDSVILSIEYEPIN